jgi:hypothetical protein
MKIKRAYWKDMILGSNDRMKFEFYLQPDDDNFDGPIWKTCGAKPWIENTPIRDFLDFSDLAEVLWRNKIYQCRSISDDTVKYLEKLKSSEDRR